MEETKPCPFCGSLSEIFSEHPPYCYLNMITDEILFNTEYTSDEMKRAWNTRCEQTCQNIGDDEDTENEFKCSVCGNHITDCEGYYVHGTWNYCSKCGRKVVD